MISIYFRPDKTQILQASYRKDKKLIVEDYAETSATLDYITMDGAAGTARLQEFLHELKKETDIATDDVYIVLPDYIFSYIESVDYIDDTNLQALIYEQVGEPADKFYITMPIVTTSPAPDRSSVYAVRKAWVDRLVEASMSERIALASVEPASMSFYRTLAQWNMEMPLVEIFPQHASFVTYSPAGGVFKQDSPDLTEENLLKNGLQANSFITTAYASNDFSAGQTYQNMNTDMPYIVISDNPKITTLDAVRLRSPEETIKFPEYILAPMMPSGQQKLWMPVIGTLLQERVDNEQDFDNPIFEEKAAFITVKNANLLPEKAKQAARNRQWKRIIQRGCRMLCIIMAVVVVLDIASIIYFSSYQYNPVLEEDYQQAKQDIASIQKEVDIINMAHKDAQNPMASYRMLVENRPDGVGFTSLTVGIANPERDRAANGNQSEDASAESKKPSMDYITLDAVAGNEMLFQDFRARLNQEEKLYAPSINSISADASGFKVAKISIGRR